MITNLKKIVDAKIHVCWIALFISLQLSAQETVISSKFLKQPVVEIRANGLGAGFLIGKDHKYLYIITAAHVIEELPDSRSIAKKIEVTYFSRQTTLINKVEHVNWDRDFAIISCSIPQGYSIPVSYIPGNIIKEGQLICVIGHPNDQWEVNNINRIKTTINIPDDNLDEFTIYRQSIDKGNSGGPVLDNDGAIIGMILKLTNTYAICVKASYLMMMAENHSIPTNLLKGIHNNKEIDRLYEEEQLRQPVVRIISTEEGNGFIIGNKGNSLYIMTAHHVVDQVEGNISIKFRFLEHKIPAEILGENKREDIAVLKCKLPKGITPPSSYSISRQSLLENQDITVIQHPLGEDHSVINQENRIIFIGKGLDKHVFHISTKSLIVGNQGGPVLNEQNELIGMLIKIEGKLAVCNNLDIILDATSPSYWNIPTNLLNGIGKEKHDQSQSRINDLGKNQPDENTIKSSYFDNLAGHMKLIKGGTYLRGSDDQKPDWEIPIPDFYIGQFEVTQAQWEEIMKNNPSKFQEGGNYPVESVSWEDAQEFIRKLNTRTKHTYRLLTEAEWEYVAGGGNHNRTIYSGTDDEKSIYQYANFCDISCSGPMAIRAEDHNDQFKETAPVGSFLPNQLGVYDMTGNVVEWCEDTYLDHYILRNHKAVFSSQTSKKVVRGGSWTSPVSSLKITNRGYLHKGYKSNYAGFRLARTL